MSADKPISENLQEYARSIQQEFELAQTGTSDQIAENARKRLSMLLPNATLELEGILRNGTKDDAIRMQAVKLIFEYTLGKPVATGAEMSDVDKIIQSLMAQPSSAQ